MAFRRNRSWIILVTVAISIKIFSFFPGAVEKYYSVGLYPFIGRLQRILFGWISFSIGDFFYIAAGLWLIIGIVVFIKRIIRREAGREYLFSVAKKIIACCLWIYVLFNLLWGLNYDRRGIDYQMQLQVKPYSNADLQELLQLIVDRLNELDSAGRLDRKALVQKKYLFRQSVQAYTRLSGAYSIFDYPSPSVKPSLFSYLGDYLGFTGYYNPFSGEAQVNTTVPVYVRPFTTCHEIGHQLGYAKENEANFAGYLAAKSSDDPAFRYSVYFDLYTYAASELYVRDSTLLVPLREQLKPLVRKDFHDLRAFFRRYENPLEPYIRSLYGRYLEANRQPKGMLTYDEVIGRVIAYYKKYGSGEL